MDYDEYVKVLSGLLSDDPERVREANAKLFRAVIDDAGDKSIRPAFALAEAERMSNAAV